jgi:uncharacterized protein
VIGKFVLRYRAVIGIILLAITAYAGYETSRLRIGTSFVNFFPRNHPYVQLYHDFQRYGGAQTLTLMVEVKRGDIFNTRTLQKIQDITFAFDLLPGIIHQSVRSLASYRVTYVEALPGNLVSKTYMYPDVPTTQAQIDELKKQVRIHSRALRYLVSDDGQRAAIECSFTESRLNYHDLFLRVQDLIKKYQDDNTTIYAAGEPMVRGYGYYYFPLLAAIFFLSDGLMILILYIYFRGRSTWWAPVVTGLLSTLWGLGFIGFMGYEFDPVMIVIRFILTARDMSHGIQWQGRYYDELEARGYDKNDAIEATTSLMLPPGLLSILADIAGIIFISFGGIPTLQEVASSGAVWLGGSLTMVFIFQPIMMSYLRTPKRIEHVARVEGSWYSRLTDSLVNFPTTPGLVRNGALVTVALLIVVGFASGLRAKIGYSQPGTPLYRQNSKVNKDLRAVGRYFPLDEGWIIFEGIGNAGESQREAGEVYEPDVVRLQRDFARYLQSDPDVDRVISVVPDILEPYNREFHYGEPKYHAPPATLDAVFGLYMLYMRETAPGESAYWISEFKDDTCMRVLLHDHTYDTLNRLRQTIRNFLRIRGQSDPAFRRIRVRYLGGIAGLYASANDVLYEIDFVNISFVLAVVFLFCTVTYRSLVAGLLFIVSCIAANFTAFIYMRLANIGITIDTIPVISLGIGLGVDYGIYVVSRIRDECIAGRELDDAVSVALRETGSAVFATFSVIVAGLAPWMFSPVLFHSEMSVLLMILMFTNMIVGVFILPAYIAWMRPQFIFGDTLTAKTEPRVAVD